MKDLGYLYVLANSSMPGVVKIGKTTRTPNERSQELSGVTGLPTPFIVVYEQLFSNCAEAEAFVHVLLGQKGYRVADNREFFNAPVTEVVRAINAAPGIISVNGEKLTKADSNDNAEEFNDLFAEHNKDNLDDLLLTDVTDDFDSGIPFCYQWYEILEKAEASYYGYGDAFVDEREALRLYGQAAKLGSLSAYAKIGAMYESGEGVAADKAKALEYFKEGARKGNAYCYWKIGKLFYFSKNLANAEKGFDLFVKNWKNELPDKQHQFLLDWREIDIECSTFILEKLFFNEYLCKSLDQVIKERKYGIIAMAERQKKTYISKGEQIWVGRYQGVVNYLKQLN